MELIVEKVLERDIDLLIINKLIYDKKVLKYFLNKISKKGYKVHSIQHSLMEQAGESDITVIVEKNKHKIGLLIEDKINACAMPEQRKRYNTRGENGIKNKSYDEFFVFMIAPSDYLKSNTEAKLYENQISYEELKKLMKDDIYATTLFDKAIEEKKTYVIVENTNVTTFWEQYYALIRQNYPGVKINEVHGPRGNNACWPELSTYYPNVKIIQKSDRGFLDLTFSKMAKHPYIFHKYIDNVKESDMNIVVTGKSMAVRLKFTEIDFKGSFDEQIDNVKDSLNKSLRLYELLNKIDVENMYKEIEVKKADINSLEDFDRIYNKKGTIVNYDLRRTYRSSTKTVEAFGATVDYPNVQRYQKGVKPTTILFMIKNNTLFRLKRVEPNNPNSNYYVEDITETVSEKFYVDDRFFNIDHNPVNVNQEELLEIIDRES